MLAESKEGVTTPLQYEVVRLVLWMFGEPFLGVANSPKPEEEMAKMKLSIGDRLEFELNNGQVMLEHLGPAPNLVFAFLRFAIKTRPAKVSSS